MPMLGGAGGFNVVYTSYGQDLACSGDPRDNCNPILIGEDDTAASFSYGRRWRNNIMIGATVKS